MTKDQIQKLRDLPIEGVAERLGLAPSHHRCLCPAHPDKHPSMAFNVRKNNARCYVCMDHSLDTIDLTRLVLGKTFREACEWLADEHNIIIEQHKPAPADDRKPATFDASRYERFFQRPFLSEAASHFLFAERRLDPRVVSWCRLTSWRDRNGIDWLQIPYYDQEYRLIGVQNRNLSNKPSPVPSRQGRGVATRPTPEPLPIGRGVATTGDSSMSGVTGCGATSNGTTSGGATSDGATSEIATSVRNLTPPLTGGDGGGFGRVVGPDLVRFRFPLGSRCSIYNLPVLAMLMPGEPLWITEGCSDCWAMLSAGHKAIAIPSATLLKVGDKAMLQEVVAAKHTPVHMYPDQDEPGERLFSQLQQVLPKIERHQLPPDCKDFAELYVRFFKR